jgi:hypothetical protein
VDRFGPHRGLALLSGSREKKHPTVDHPERLAEDENGMGLDTYAQREPDTELPNEDRRAFEAAGIELCGGLMSGPPDSFRGKVYAGLYEALVRCDPREFDDGHGHRFSDVEDAVTNLRKFFEVCVERGLGLFGWW